MSANGQQFATPDIKSLVPFRVAKLSLENAAFADGIKVFANK